MRSIEITFPVDVEMTAIDERTLSAAISTICKRYETKHPDRVMWPAGYGQKMLSNPFLVSDDEPIEYDDSCYHIECAERENRDHPSNK